MAIILKNSVFLHFPKAGGMWTEKVLRALFKDAICLRGIRTVGHETIRDLINFQEQDFILNTLYVPIIKYGKPNRVEYIERIFLRN